MTLFKLNKLGMLSERLGKMSRPTEIETAQARVMATRVRAVSLYIRYKEAEQEVDEARAELESLMRSKGLKTARTEKFVSVINQRPHIEITHEPSVIQWLQEEPNVEADVYIGLKKKAFDTLAKTVMKKTGEVIPGTNYETRESVSVKLAKKEDNGKRS